MDLKTRLSNARHRLPLLRRSSHTSTSARSPSSAGSDRAPRRPSMSMSLSKLPAVSSESVPDGAEQRLTKSEVLPPKQTRRLSSSKADRSRTEDGTVDGTSASRQSHTQGQDDSAAASPHPPTPVHNDRAHPAVTLETPTPVRLPVDPVKLAQQKLDAATELVGADSDDQPTELRPTSARAQSKPNPPSLLRRQSLVTPSNARVIKTLLEADNPQAAAAIASGPPTSADYFAGATAFSAGMLHRKIWVKRPNASATLVQIREDDLVDNVRDMILKKYANSLGKTFDSPDVTLRIHPRDSATNAGDRILGPEEEMCRTLDAYYPGGQTVNEALLIEVPHRKTPKPSPGLPYQYLARVPHPEHVPPYESSAGYFPPMADVHPSPAAMTAVSQESRASVAHTQHLHSISVLQSGQLPHLPNLPSPGATSRSRHHGGRPRIARQQTASPTTLTGNAPTVVTGRPSQQRQRHDSTASDAKHSTSSGHPPIPTPPAPTDAMVRQSSNPPTPRVASPIDKKRKKSKAVEHPSLPAGLLDNSVPPINVLIVEDNIINLRVLGAFMQRLKVRWQRAMNGKEAVTKWRTGGFHLVLMDIQLPIMNGLEATKEIRRLERVNNIGVFSSGSHEAPNNRLSEANNHGRVEEDDKLGDRSLFKSPVIIVALTASSLQSDRHEALAAGCNDFLTKPVNFVWLERKVKEWGCMQALIDYDGWRKWKDFAAAKGDAADQPKASTGYSSYASRPKPTLSPVSPTSEQTRPLGINGVTSPKSPDGDKKNKRRSLGVGRPPALPEEESTVSLATEAEDS